MKRVTEEFADNFFEHINNNLFRLETLQDYSAEDDDKIISNYIKTGNLGYNISELPFWNYIKNLNNTGINTQRVKVLSYPLTDYMKFSLAFFKESSKYSGDKVYLIDKKEFDKLNLINQDFWLKDDKYALVGNYGVKGKLLFW